LPYWAICVPEGLAGIVSNFREKSREKIAELEDTTEKKIWNFSAMPSFLNYICKNQWLSLASVL
jgi:hypothetical protein